MQKKLVDSRIRPQRAMKKGFGEQSLSTRWEIA
jgi:hypothetical protein